MPRRGNEPSTEKGKRSRAGRRSLVLLVEDHPDERQIYTRYLSSHGFRIETATDGERAVSMARELRPDLIVMDLSLPHVNGWEATRRLKRDTSTRHIPIIACTGHVLHGSVELALEAGCEAYVVKPCLPKDLLAEIRRVLSRHRPRRS
jgi:CheY-like chemotaxis protein